MATVNRVLASQPSISFFVFYKTVNFPRIITISSHDFYLFFNFCVLNFLCDFANGALQLSSCSCVSLRSRRFASSLSTEKKSLIAEGPSLGEFISGEVSPQENPYKRKKGQRYEPNSNRSNVCCKWWNRELTLKCKCASWIQGIMQQSIPAVPIPPPGQPRGIQGRIQEFLKGGVVHYRSNLEHQWRGRWVTAPASGAISWEGPESYPSPLGKNNLFYEKSSKITKKILKGGVATPSTPPLDPPLAFAHVVSPGGGA